MKKILTLIIISTLLLSAEAITKDKSFTLDCKAKQTLEIDNALIVQNIGNQTLLYSIDPLNTDNTGFRLFKSDILILSADKKLYIKCLNNYGKAFLQASKGGY